MIGWIEWGANNMTRIIKWISSGAAIAFAGSVVYRAANGGSGPGSGFFCSGLMDIIWLSIIGFFFVIAVRCGIVCENAEDPNVNCEERCRIWWILLALTIFTAVVLCPAHIGFPR
jgi:hypothetical protein